MPGTHVRRRPGINRLADHLVACVAEQPFHLGVDQDDSSTTVDQHDAGRTDLDCKFEYFFRMHFPRSRGDNVPLANHVCR